MAINLHHNCLAFMVPVVYQPHHNYHTKTFLHSPLYTEAFYHNTQE